MRDETRSDIIGSDPKASAKGVYTTSVVFVCFGAGLDGAYFDLCRRWGPYLVSTNGMGTMTSAMKPMRVEAHRGFSASYICVAKRGNAAPNAERATVFAARADAATKRYASIM